jgi:hypothetical protein
MLKRTIPRGARPGIQMGGSFERVDLLAVKMENESMVNVISVNTSGTWR